MLEQQPRDSSKELPARPTRREASARPKPRSLRRGFLFIQVKPLCLRVT